MANNNERDAYEELLRKLSSGQGGVAFNQPEGDVKNNGEIYFSPNSGVARNDRPRKKTGTRSAGQNNTQPAKKSASKSKRKKKKRINIIASLCKVLIVIAVMVVLAFLIKIPIMSCVNDVLALDGSHTEHRVTIDRTLEYDEVIDILSDKNLISNPTFCKFIAKFMDFDEYSYPAGDYNLSTAMGVEGMLQEIANAGNEESTVMLTFPEGYTVDQIAEKLELNGVCSKKGFYAALLSDKIYEKYDIFNDINRSARYHAVEGYLYPDTYEFYVGEDPYSVIERFINNFLDKWTEDNEARCASLGYTMDEVITVASILEKEAKDAEQMTLVASIIYNRLENPGSFPFINCDSTKKYIENSESVINDKNMFKTLSDAYDTYLVQGLPAGPIANPGTNAIYAALHPDSTGYYYFLHDSEGKIYVAKTASEHERNGQYIN